MNVWSLPQRALFRLSRRIWAVPIFFKVLGVGGAVALVFGVVTIWQMRASVSQQLLSVVEDNTLFAAHTLASELERPMTTGNGFEVQERLNAFQALTPSLRYAIARNPQGQVIAHTFEHGVPEDLTRLFERDSREELLVVANGGERIFDARVPILNGYAGTAQLGVSDRAVSEEIGALTQTMLGTLLACAGLGAALALALTHLLTMPIHELVDVADRLREGDFAARTRLDTGDEVGRLAMAFDQLALSLEKYRKEVQDKERTRISLIQKIIQTQEEERKTISQELHDHFGQSLLAVLLSIQSAGRRGELRPELAGDMEAKLRELIDDVRRLAQGMRPPVLDDYGLELALGRLVSDVSEHTGIALDYQYISPEDAGRLPPPVEVTLYRIAQEAVANVVRHSGARRASVVVWQHTDRTTLLVEDQGRGFDIESQSRASSAGLGLSGMCERAALLGGRCIIDASPGRGTTVRVEIPLAS